MRTLNRVVKTLWSWHDPELQSGEGVVLDSVGVLNRGLFAPQVRLILTTNRLIVLPSRFARWPLPMLRGPIEIQLSEIDRTESGPWTARVIGGVPGVPQFIVFVKDGTKYKFQTYYGGRWQREIESRLQ